VRSRLILSVLVVSLGIGVVASVAGAQSRTFDLLTASIADIQDAVDGGALTYETLVRLYLARIDAYDKKGPRLNAVIAINPRATETARALDEERKAKGRRGPLHGIPVAIKDNVDVADMPSAGGSLAFKNSVPARDATIVQRLRDAGAIVLLKTNMDELALGSRGLSSLGGQTLDPYDLTRNPGGSSGGTGVAVNVSFATVGVGTETGVSIRSPATNNAVVGIAPTRGLVSRAGVIPISFTQDRVGAHGKTVVDAARLLDAAAASTPRICRQPRAWRARRPSLLQMSDRRSFADRGSASCAISSGPARCSPLAMRSSSGRSTCSAPTAPRSSPISRPAKI
jgi:amidase